MTDSAIVTFQVAVRADDSFLCDCEHVCDASWRCLRFERLGYWEMAGGSKIISSGFSGRVVPKADGSRLLLRMQIRFAGRWGGRCVAPHRLELLDETRHSGLSPAVTKRSSSSIVIRNGSNW